MITLVLFTALLIIDIAVVCFLIGWACCARQLLVDGPLAPTVSPFPCR
jgi:hypothetical protein